MGYTVNYLLIVLLAYGTTVEDSAYYGHKI